MPTRSITLLSVGSTAMSACSSWGRELLRSRPHAPVSSLDSQISRTCDVTHTHTHTHAHTHTVVYTPARVCTGCVPTRRQSPHARSSSHTCTHTRTPCEVYPDSVLLQPSMSTCATPSHILCAATVLWVRMAASVCVACVCVDTWPLTSGPATAALALSTCAVCSHISCHVCVYTCAYMMCVCVYVCIRDRSPMGLPRLP